MPLPAADDLQEIRGHDMDTTTGEPAGMWTRVSKTRQNEQSQIPDNMAWVRSHDYKLVAGATYEVHGKSAYKINKAFDAKWAQVLADFRSGKIRVLVVWKLDRLDRKLQAFQMIAEAMDAGGRIEFVTQPGLNDLSTMGSRIMLKCQEELAHEESQIKSDRIKINHAELKAKGSVVGRPVWGLKIGPAENGIKTLVPTPDGLKYAVPLFEMVAANVSLADACLWLDEQGVSTVTGKNGWAPRSVNQIIRCRTMMGRRTDANGQTDLKCMPLVPVDLWNAANAALNVKPHRGPLRIENKSMLSGVMRCPKCKGPMYKAMCGYGASRKAYYRCAGKGAVQRSSCRNLVPVAYADGIVNAKMLADDGMIMELRPAADGELKLALDDVKTSLRLLPDQGYDWVKEDAERANLREEQTRLLGEIEAAKVAGPKMVSTNQTYAELWSTLPTDGERNRWLGDAGVTIVGLKGDDGEVQVTCDRKLASLIYEQDPYDLTVEQIAEIPPSVNGNWVFVAPGYKHRMHRARPRS